MWIQILLMLGTALLSSVFTLILAAWLFETRIKPRLQEHVDQEVEKAIAEMGRTIEARVQAGVRAGAASVPTDVLAGATRTGVDIVALGLASLLGGGRRRSGSRGSDSNDD